MTFQGMPLATVLQALGAAAVAVTILYLLKLRRRRVTVPFSPLWSKLLAQSESRALWDRLKRLLSWLLALAFAASVALAAGDPQAEEVGEDRRSWVVLLDASASMRSTDGSPTRFDDARTKAMEVVDSLRPGDTAMIVRVDADVTPLTSFTGDRSVLSRALSDAEPGEAAADFDRALQFADAALHGRPGGWIVVASDLAGRAPRAERPAGAPPVTWAPVGERGDNVGILGFNARPYRANRRQFEVFLRVRNDGEQAAKCRVSISADGVLTEVLPLEIPPGSTVDRFFPDLVVDGRRLEARLEVLEGPDNLLPTDDVAYALLPEAAPLRVGLVTPGNLFLEAAMLLDDNLDLVTATEAGAIDPPPDAWVFDRLLPDTPPDAPALYIAPPEGDFPGAPWAVTGHEVADGLVRVQSDHPLGRWLGIPDLGGPSVSRVKVAPGDTVVMRIGDLPLVVAQRPSPGKNKTVMWTFDPLQSDLPLKSAFPLMLMHTFEWFARTELDQRSSWRVGDSWRIPVRSDAATARIVEPDGQERVAPVVDGQVRVRGRRAGFHEVLVEGADPVVVAASMQDPQESSIAPVAERVEASKATPAPLRAAATGGRPPWLLLGLFALAWLALEWGSFHRRYTV